METFLWVEKYRPRSIDECILPEDLKNTFSEFVKDKHIPNLILCGSAGVGKTTVAKAMLDEIGATSMMINGSEESGIDVLRTKIKNFASTVSLEGGRKMDGSYDVSVSSRNISNFKSKNSDVEYWIALEPESTYSV